MAGVDVVVDYYQPVPNFCPLGHMAKFTADAEWPCGLGIPSTPVLFNRTG